MSQKVSDRESERRLLTLFSVGRRMLAVNGIFCIYPFRMPDPKTEPRSV